MNNIAVIFDMDGVIADTNPTHVLAFRDFFDRHGIQYAEEQFAEHMYGKHNSYIMSRFFGRKIEGQELLDMEQEKELLFREIYQPQVQALAGFIDFFESLKKAGIPTGVATSAPRANLDLILGKLGIHTQMESTLASEDVFLHKPNPEIYLHSIANLGVPAENCVVFEDSFSGASAGLAAGANVVGVLSSHQISELPECHDFIRDFTEMDLDRLEKLVQQRSYVSETQ